MYLSALPLLVPVLSVLFGVSLAMLLFWRKTRLDTARTAAMEKCAQALGLTFSAADSFGLTQQLQDFDLFERERARWFGKGKITHVMRGLVGETDVYLFDYSYVVQAGKSRKTVTQTVFFANDKNWFLPNFHLKPERWWHKLQASLGFKNDINFSENPQFSEKFWLNGDFEALIRQQFTPELQGFLMEKPPAHLEGTNFYLIGYKPKEKMSAAAAQVFFQHCCELVSLLQQNKALDLLDLADPLERTPIPVPRTREI